jgi:hypothetical protein
MASVTSETLSVLQRRLYLSPWLRVILRAADEPKRALETARTVHEDACFRQSAPARDLSSRGVTRVIESP